MTYDTLEYKPNIHTEVVRLSRMKDGAMEEQSNACSYKNVLSR